MAVVAVGILRRRGTKRAHSHSIPCTITDASNLPLWPLKLRNGSRFWSAETSGVELVPHEVGISWYRDLSAHTGIAPRHTEFVLLPNCHQSVPIWVYTGLEPAYLQLGEQVTVGCLASEFNSNLFYTHPLAKIIGFRRSKSCPSHSVRERVCENFIPLGNNRAEERRQFV